MSEISKPIVMLRGEALQQRLSHPNVLQNRDTSRTEWRQLTQLKADVSEKNDSANGSVYGVPISAIQHCCGRGCKHCKIYWHKSAL
jgi:hypothetical protein